MSGSVLGVHGSRVDMLRDRRDGRWADGACWVVGEALIDALAREWDCALGPHARRQDVLDPLVVEYVPGIAAGRPHDPRQHAVSLTYPVRLTGSPAANGPQALDFGWFGAAEINSQLMGFGQQTVIARVFIRLAFIRLAFIRLASI